ncbi:MAG: hypothetical protein K9I71_04455 [Ignavibacteriales bacterium]|nr:hypothetical protein [Ignavibacteriales bacterium]MCF8315349.1 hypothetical protein [Ignavibacteriales bacterium]MCF8436759.1 hypothetical protein [Ignavibacteriales bacterium]
MMQKSTVLFIKVTLAVLFLLCLLEMKYGFYIFVRFSAFIGFAALAVNSSGNKRETEMVIYGVLALLFQPFYKFALGRDLWNIVDVAAALGLLLSVLIDIKKRAEH